MENNFQKPSQNTQPEFWLRGNVPGINVMLQPVAHALLQAREDVFNYTIDFPNLLLWKKPAGRASVGFHLQHLTGVLDRMLTYADGKELSSQQFSALNNEGNPLSPIEVVSLVKAFSSKVEEAMEILKTIREEDLSKPRNVGRKKLPSTVIGLLFHAAEHSQRHVGQLLVTVSVLNAG